MERVAGDEAKVAGMTDTTRRRFLQYGMAAGASLAGPVPARRQRHDAAIHGYALRTHRDQVSVRLTVSYLMMVRGPSAAVGTSK